MDDIFYENKDFRYDHRVFRHPSYVKDKHIFYHLSREEDGSLQFSVTPEGQYIMSPRYVANLLLLLVLHASLTLRFIEIRLTNKICESFLCLQNFLPFSYNFLRHSKVTLLSSKRFYQAISFLQHLKKNHLSFFRYDVMLRRDGSRGG